MVVSKLKRAQRARRLAERQRIDQGAQIVMFIENEIADTEDEDEFDDQLQERLWPVFTNHDTSTSTLGKRRNRFGQAVRHYNQPVAHSDPSNKKLVPKPEPKQTRHNRQKKARQAVGKNITFMSNWVIKEPQVADPAPADKPAPVDVYEIEDSDQEEHSGDGIDSDINNDGQHTEDEPEAADVSADDGSLVSAEETWYNSWVDDQVERYRSKPKTSDHDYLIPEKLQKIKQMIEDDWVELNEAITKATKEYKRLHAENKKFKFPSLMLDELREYNHQKRELARSGVKSAATNASILTAQSSCRRLPSPNSQFSSGVGRAKKIRYQANYLLKNEVLSFSKIGHATQHKSMLDDKRVTKALLSWTSTKKPGEVTPRSFHKHTNSILPSCGYNQTISQMTAY